MTKKHFESMALYIRAHIAMAKDAESRAMVRGMVSLALHMGSAFSPRFDRTRFRAACGLCTAERIAGVCSVHPEAEDSHLDNGRAL